MGSWHSYPDIFNLGHPAVKELLDGPVNVEEKVDGSQISFGLIEGVVRVKSKGAELVVEAPEKMFTQAVQMIQQVHATHGLTPDWTYRGEYLQKPKHNALAYDRIPVQHIILFDINEDEEAYLSPQARVEEAARLGFECVPVLYSGMVTEATQLRALLETTSVLGGQQIEGMVVKPVGYDLYGRDHKVLMGKFVSEQYREVQKGAWREANPTSGDVVEQLGQQHRTVARWMKAVQHLREAGTLELSPRDIGALMREVPQDVAKECREEIMAALWKWAWPKIARDSTRGLPEWYKQWLLDQQFGEKP